MAEQNLRQKNELCFVLQSIIRNFEHATQTTRDMCNLIDDFSPEGTFMSESDALDLIEQMKTKLDIQASREEILADYHHVPEDGPFGPTTSDIKKKLDLRDSEKEIEKRMEKDESYRADINARWEETLSEKEKYIRRLHASGRLHTYKEGEEYPWLDVIASMCVHPDKICVSESRCDQCHQPLITIWFNSPAATWTYMCGRAGEMEICPSCMRQISYGKHGSIIMN